MRKLAILRPEPGASASLERARDLGLEAFALPLFEIAAVDWEAPDPGGFHGVLVTSANAVRHGGRQLEHLRTLPAFAVGEATAKAAGAAGFTVAATGNEGAGQLLRSIDPGLRLFHPCGRDTTLTGKARQTVISMPVYEARAIADPPGLERLDGSVALVHSPRAGRRLAELVEHRSAIAIAAISPDAAEAAGSGWKEIEAAAKPEDGALLALAARLCEKGGGQ